MFINKRLRLIFIFIAFFLISGCIFSQPQKQTRQNYPSAASTGQAEKEEVASAPDPTEFLYVEFLKKRIYSASDIKIEETLNPGINYQRYMASYLSDGLKIYGLFTVPNNKKPTNGFPAIVFLHGYLDPKIYETTARYVAYQDGFAKKGFITFKPDLRGHGRSEGNPVNTHFSQEYVVDTLNLISALKVNKNTDSSLIGLWGHSNGGGITLRALEVSPDIKAAVIWAGVVGSYEDMLVTYRFKIPWLNSRPEAADTLETAVGSLDDLIKKYGPPDLKSFFWSKIDPYSYIKDISAPIQLHHGTADDSVPIEFSQHLKDVLTAAGKTVEYYGYPDADHNLSSPAFSNAMKRSIDFFKKYLTPKTEKVSSKETLVQDNKNNQAGFLSPLARSQERITKKTFGMYITPETSPVQPENFSGYHTGVDFEIFPDELNVKVPVKAVCSGQLKLKEYANGYGGVIIQSCTLNNELITVIYGHLNLASIKFNKGDKINIGEEIGILGKDKSIETDGERRHLHLSFHIGSSVNIKGYVNTKAELRDWLDPCLYACAD